MQPNFWTNDDAHASRNETLLNLGFVPSEELHRCGFKWTASKIEWYIDGGLVHAAFDSSPNPTPKATESLQKIMVNAWPVDEAARTTDSSGTAAFYSSRARKTGTVQFCVASVSAAGMDCVSGGNVETCDAITK